MAHIDEEYYKSDYMGNPIDDPKEFMRMAKRASELVDIATRFKSLAVADGGFQEKYLKKAVAAQVEFYSIYGGYEEVISDDMSSVTIGSFSYSNIQDGQNTKKILADNSLRYLSAAGLLYGGVNIRG